MLLHCKLLYVIKDKEFQLGRNKNEQTIQTVLTLFHLSVHLSKDLLYDDGECDWTADELPGDNPWLLVSSHFGEAAPGGYC